MSIRNGFLVCMAIFATVHSLSAAPPIKPQVEGRETNYVAREYYLLEKSVEQFENVQTPSTAKGERVGIDNFINDVLTEAWQYFLSRIVIPFETW